MALGTIGDVFDLADKEPNHLDQSESLGVDLLIPEWLFGGASEGLDDINDTSKIIEYQLVSPDQEKDFIDFERSKIDSNDLLNSNQIISDAGVDYLIKMMFLPTKSNFALARLIFLLPKQPEITSKIEAKVLSTIKIDVDIDQLFTIEEFTRVTDLVEKKFGVKRVQIALTYLNLLRHFDASYDFQKPYLLAILGTIVESNLYAANPLKDLDQVSIEEICKNIEKDTKKAKDIPDEWINFENDPGDLQHPLAEKIKTEHQQKTLSGAIRYFIALKTILPDYCIKQEHLERLLGFVCSNLSNTALKQDAINLYLGKINEDHPSLLYEFIKNQYITDLSFKDVKNICYFLKELIKDENIYDLHVKVSLVDSILLLCTCKEALLADFIKPVFEEFIKIFESQRVSLEGLDFYRHTETKLAEFIKLLPNGELDNENNPIAFSFGTKNKLNIYQQLLEKIQSRIKQLDDKFIFMGLLRNEVWCKNFLN